MNDQRNSIDILGMSIKKQYLELLTLVLTGITYGALRKIIQDQWVSVTIAAALMIFLKLLINHSFKQK